MFKLLSFVIVLLFFHSITSQQFKPFIQSGRIELLGVVSSYDNPYCCNNTNDLWIFMSIIIPGLVKGNINAISNITNGVFNSIIILRQDVNVNFNYIFSDDNYLFNISGLCEVFFFSFI